MFDNVCTSDNKKPFIFDMSSVTFPSPASTSAHFPEMTVITGPMFSGKTSELQRLVYKQSATKKCLIVNSIVDLQRQNAELVKKGEKERVVERGEIAVTVSHAGCEYAALMASSLMEDVVRHPNFKEADLVAIDEAQFFKEDDLEAFVKLARYKLSKDVIVAGLHSDSESRPFMNHNFLVCNATKYKLLTSKCQSAGCFTNAHRTFANFNKNSRVQVNISGYVPLCDFHYFKAMNDSHL